MGLERTGVVRALRDIDTGVRMLVGVSPVRPSIRASKVGVFRNLVGVSMSIPAITLRRFCGLTERLRDSGRERRDFLARGRYSSLLTVVTVVGGDMKSMEDVVLVRVVELLCIISSVVLCSTAVGSTYCGEFSDFTTVTRVPLLAGCDLVAIVTVVGAVDTWWWWGCWGTRRIGWEFVVVTTSIVGGSWYSEVEIC